MSDNVLEIEITPLESKDDNEYELYKMPLKHKLFKIKGRMGRLNYFVFFFLFNVFSYVFSILITRFNIMSHHNLNLVSILFLLVLYCAIFLLGCAAIKRLHDLNHSAWFLLPFLLISGFGLIPSFKILFWLGQIFSLYILLWPGKKEANRYGEATDMLSRKK